MFELLNVYSMKRVYSKLVRIAQRLNLKDCHWQILEDLSRSKARWSASCMIVYCRRTSKARHINPGKPKIFREFSYLYFEPKDTRIVWFEPNWQAYWDHDQDCPRLVSMKAWIVLESSIYLIYWILLPAAFESSLTKLFECCDVNHKRDMNGSKTMTRTLFNVKKQYIGFHYLDRLQTRTWKEFSNGTSVSNDNNQYFQSAKAYCKNAHKGTRGLKCTSRRYTLISSVVPKLEFNINPQ